MKIKKTLSSQYTSRYILLAFLLGIALIGLTWRVISLQVYEKKFLTSQGDARTMRVVTTAPYRGMITDRNGEPLAISTPVDSIWINPKEVDLDHPQLITLAKMLNISDKKMRQRISQNSEREFLYLKRHVVPQEAEKIRALKIPGVHLKQEYARYYPAGEVTAQVLGFTNVDGQGQEGLELAYDDHLKGEAGKKRILRDRAGRVVEYIEALKDMRSGQNMALSLDQRLQYLAFRELKFAVNQHSAESGTAVVLDVETGEVLSMVSYPSYNPNQREKKRDDRFRNRGVTDFFEPGSPMKTFSVLSALQNGGVTSATLVDTSPGYMAVGRNMVTDDKHNYGIIDVATIMKRSSNVGVAKLTLSLPPEKLLETYTRMGFGTITDSGFPGESAGSLLRPGKNSPFVLATMAFGYGIAVTPLQLAQAYSILGAEGYKKSVGFIKNEQASRGERVIEPEIASQLVEILRGVAERPGSNSKVIGYQVAGKSGTVRTLGPQGYNANEHISVFAGLIPANNPRFSIVVKIDKPQGKGVYYGNQVAAPVFAKIASGAVRLFNVTPDILDNQGLQVAQFGKDIP